MRVVWCFRPTFKLIKLASHWKKTEVEENIGDLSKPPLDLFLQT